MKSFLWVLAAMLATSRAVSADIPPPPEFYDQYPASGKGDAIAIFDELNDTSRAVGEITRDRVFSTKRYCKVTVDVLTEGNVRAAVTVYGSSNPIIRDGWVREGDVVRSEPMRSAVTSRTLPLTHSAAMFSLSIKGLQPKSSVLVYVTPWTC